MADNKINVSFLKGTQAGFDGLSSYKAGAFYLTTDTNRLYFADGTTKANYLNKYVHTVENTAKLTAAINSNTVVEGDFVYVADSNALVAIRNYNGQRWIQINAYNNDDTEVSGLTFTQNTVNSDDTEIVFNYNLEQKTKDAKGDYGNTTSITGSFKITAEDIKEIIDIAVGIDATLRAGKAVVKTSGTGSAGNGFTIEGKGSVRIDGKANALTITGINTEYTLASPENSNNIVLTDSDGVTSEVAIVEGNQISIDASENNKIKIEHGIITTTSTTPDKKDLENSRYNKNSEAVYEQELDVITNVTVDNGHVTGYTKQKFVMPAERDIKSMSIGDVGSDKQGKLDIVVENRKTGDLETYTSNADFYVTVGGDTKQTKYLKQDLNVYTIEEIDTKIDSINDTIKGTNAMVYKGTVGSNDSTLKGSNLPSTGVSIGDTYKVDLKGRYAGSFSCEPGDLLIAIAKEGYAEDEDGFLPVGGVTWTHVPSGNDYDATFSFKANTANNKLTLIEDLEEVEKGSIAFTTDNDALSISSSSANSGKDMTVTVNHKSYTTQKGEVKKKEISHSPSSKNTFTAITGFITDKGHITEYTETEYTLPKDRDSQYNLTAIQSSTANKAEITLAGIVGSDADGDAFKIYLEAGTDLVNSTSSNIVTFNHKTYNDPSTPTANTGTLGTNSSGQKTITAVTGLGTTNGHVTSIKTSEFAIPKDSQYTLKDVTLEAITVGNDSGFKITNTLEGVTNSGADGDKMPSSFSLISNSLTLESKTDSSGKAAIAVNLQWGSF